MSDKQAVIYTAQTSQHAHLLKNLLIEAGIRAMVVNDVLERGSGVDIVGWPTSARVVVDEDDAPRARQFAVNFDRKGAATASGPAVEEPGADPMIVDEWPQCPDCNTPRSTRCPICGTAGSEFPPADMGFTWIPDAQDTAAGASCSCGPEGCTGDDSAAEEGEFESPLPMLMCPTCDEPFVPEYPAVCEWCGHQFDDGFDVELLAGPVEQLNTRVMLAAIVLLSLAAAVVAYFTFLVRY